MYSLNPWRHGFGGERLAAVPESVICELRARIDACSDCVELSAAAPLRHNQRVRIIKGPFADHEALFYARRGEDRAGVSC